MTMPDQEPTSDKQPTDRGAPPSPLIVGIGASAGGLAAFKSFFSNMPADTGMTFVLVQHLDPDHKSLLVELLTPHAGMPVSEARDGEKMEADHVYVIPPNATLTFADGSLRVSRPAPARANRRPIDTLFLSLAENHNDCAVGIVLSGVGSDGSLGLGTIKERGGLTMAQAEFDSSPMSGMPYSAVATGSIDIIAPVETMPGKLIEYQRHLHDVSKQKDDEGTRQDASEYLPGILSALRHHIKHDFGGYKEKTLTRRIQRRMQILQIEAFQAYLELINRDAQEAEALFQELLIGVTEFFRDPPVFEALGATVIPALLAAQRGNDPIRIWVPGCATGEEVYSIAILLKEGLGHTHDNSGILIFGSDLDAEAIAFARAARYRKVEGLSAERLDRWFVKNSDDYCPVAAIRELCVFSVHSLVKDPPFSKLDLISCRNVLIYLGSEAQSRVMQTFHYALHPGGYLLLGPSEGAGRESRLFNVVDKKHRILQRREGKQHLPAFPPGYGKMQSSDKTSPATGGQGEDPVARGVGRAMEKYAPVHFVIDENHDVLRFSGGETGLYLEPSTGPASLNLFSILRKDLRAAVRAALQAVASDQKAVVNDDLIVRLDGRTINLKLIVEPMVGSSGHSTLFVVAFRELDVPSVAPNAPGEAADAPGSNETLQREVRMLRAQLQAVRDEMETHLEENKSATEEYQSVNEELQSTNEELETAKEEMQSVNEELQTINSEMNAKNDMLTQTNSDLQNLLDSTHIATIFLDQAMRIRNFTPVVTELFPLRYSDLGRSINDFVSHLDYDELRQDVLDVQRKLTNVEREVTLADGSATFIVRIRPYRTVKNVIDGVVLTFNDITARKQQENHLDFLMREMSHRTNNLLAVIQAMAQQTGRRSDNYKDFTARFNDRVQGLAYSNRLLVQRDWRGADVDELVRAQTAPFIEPGLHRLVAEGPSVMLTVPAVQAVGLALHELATNASKYGALSAPEGSVHVRWELYEGKNEPCFRLVWQERDGPPVKQPKRKGFGSMVLDEMTMRALDAETKIEFLPDGVRWTLASPAIRAVTISRG